MAGILQKHVELGGVVCAALTPLHADLSPDLDGAVAHCARLLRAGCDGINLLGTTGEATSLSVEQRLAVMEAVAAASLPLDRIMVGTGASALADAVRLTTRAVELGFAGALVIPPFYFKAVPEDGVVAYYCALIERVGDPRLRLFFYNFPQLSGITIEREIIERVGERFAPMIRGVKDSSGAAGYAAGLVRAFPDLAIFPSSEANLNDARAAGFAGCISATLNVTAPLAQLVWSGARNGAAVRDLGAMREAIGRFPLVPALRFLSSAIHNDGAWLHMLPPLEPLQAAQSYKLLSALAAIPAFARVKEAIAA